MQINDRLPSRSSLQFVGCVRRYLLFGARANDVLEVASHAHHRPVTESRRVGVPWTIVTTEFVPARSFFGPPGA